MSLARTREGPKGFHSLQCEGLIDVRTGLFTGPDVTADKVIATGDTLFGSTVTQLEFAKGLNDAGDIAFKYELSNGRSGVALAVVPEPASAALLTTTAAMFIAARRTKRQP